MKKNIEIIKFGGGKKLFEDGYLYSKDRKLKISKADFLTEQLLRNEKEKNN